MEPNIKIIENFVSDPDCLFHEIKNNVDWDERMKARKTASFGVSYNYSDITYPQTDMPVYLGKICQAIDQIIGFMPNNCLMNYYLNGNSFMGYHSDSSEELAENTGVVIISLGSERPISYRLIANKEHKVKYSLKPGTLLYMDKNVQSKWQHAIPKKKTDVGERISLTFRYILK